MVRIMERGGRLWRRLREALLMVVGGSRDAGLDPAGSAGKAAASPEHFPDWLPPRVIPFPQRTVPDEALARMVETLDTDPTCDLEGLSARFGYPPALIQRDLPLYRLRYEAWIDSRLRPT